MLEPRTEFTDLMIKNKKLEAEIERLRAALIDLLKFCDTTSDLESDWERAVERARKAISNEQLND